MYVLALALTFIHVAALHRAKRVHIVATTFVVAIVVSPIFRYDLFIYALFLIFMFDYFVSFFIF